MSPVVLMSKENIEQDSSEEDSSEEVHEFAIVEYRSRKRSRAEKRKELGAFCTCSPIKKRHRDIPLCLLEIFLTIFLGLLLLHEFWVMLALRTRYFLELENWFKLIIFSLALTSIFFRKDFDVLNVVASTGICLAWIEVIFLIGRLGRS